MLGIAEIQSINNKAAKEAARNRRKPYVLWGVEEVDSFPPFPFPNLGYYVPKGWERAPDVTGSAQFFCRDDLKGTQVWFVDSTGLGYEYGPAMTLRRFKEALKAYVKDHPDHGFGIVEQGMFQVYIGAFRKVKKDE